MKDVNGKLLTAGDIVQISDKPVKKYNGTFLVERVYEDENREVAFVIKMSPKLGRINTNAPVMYLFQNEDAGTIKRLDDVPVTARLIQHMEEMRDNATSMLRQYRSKYVSGPQFSQMIHMKMICEDVKIAYNNMRRAS